MWQTSHIILHIDCRRRSWRQEIQRYKKPNFWERCLLATQCCPSATLTGFTTRLGRSRTAWRFNLSADRRGAPNMEIIAASMGSLECSYVALALTSSAVTAKAVCRIPRNALSVRYRTASNAVRTHERPSSHRCGWPRRLRSNERQGECNGSKKESHTQS